MALRLPDEIAVIMPRIKKMSKIKKRKYISVCKRTSVSNTHASLTTDGTDSFIRRRVLCGATKLLSKGGFGFFHNDLISYNVLNISSEYN
jgi:hypothetical protein